MKKPLIAILLLVLGGLGLASLFTVTETEYAIRFQLGRIIKVDYQYEIFCGQLTETQP